MTQPLFGETPRHRSPMEALVRMVNRRSLIVEPLTIIAIVSLLSSWAMQPYILRALAPQGAVAQSAAQAALWLAGILSPLAAFAKAVTGALICWACAVWLDERLSLMKLLSVFCVAELVFALRDVSAWAVMALHGLGGAPSTVMPRMAFGLNAVLPAHSPLARVAFESWDVFTVVWAAAAFVLVRAVFRTEPRTALALALAAFAFRTLFAAGSLLFSL